MDQNKIIKTQWVLEEIGKEVDYNNIGRHDFEIMAAVKKNIDNLYNFLDGENVFDPIAAKTEYYSVLLLLSQIGHRRGLHAKAKVSNNFNPEGILKVLKEANENLYDINSVFCKIDKNDEVEISNKIQAAIECLDSAILEIEVNINAT